VNDEPAVRVRKDLGARQMHQELLGRRDAILRGLLDRNSSVQRTAQDLGISRATMYREMRRYGIVPSEPHVTRAA
jgi:transcriptional regulator of acetoin/glycerol metabolism